MTTKQEVERLVERLRVTHECTAGFNRTTWLPGDWNLLNEAADALASVFAGLERAGRDAELLGEIRGWLDAGATIKATDLAKPVLTLLPDGSFYGGMAVKFPDAALAAQERKI